jgi:hypothetical protein
VRIAVIVPAGPGDDVLDTVDSVVRYADPSRVILVVDDRGDQRPEQSQARLRQLSPDIAVLPAPAARPGRYGGLWVKLSAGYQWILTNLDPDLVMRLDADAVMLGPGLEDRAERSFASDRTVGLLGSYRIGADGGRRDFSWVARQLRSETGLRGFARLGMRGQLRHYHRLARRNGYEDGEHVLGGAYIHRAAAISAIAGNGWLDEARSVERTRLGDDHLISMLTVAAGYRIADFGGPDGPMALAWQGLPAHPADLLALGKLVTHSVRSWHDLTEQQIREIFAAARA